MSRHTEEAHPSRRFHLEHAEQLTRIERIALLTFVGGLALIDLIGLLGAQNVNPAATLLSVATTLVFTVYIWSPLAATCGLGLAVGLSLIVGTGANGLVAGAIAAWLVMRLGTTPLAVGYFGGFLAFSALFASNAQDDEAATGSLAAALILALVAGGVGLALRAAYAHGHRLEDELVEQAEREREAVLAERKWIAGELHDSIAHHLTVVAMHVQLLDDDTVRRDSQEAIRSAARKALSDLRFVIRLAEDAPDRIEMQSGDLAVAFAEAVEEFEAANHSVTVLGDPSDEGIPRGAEIILARVVRESATNILKYAGPGEVRLSLGVERESILLRILSPLPSAPRRDLPSTGTGLNRMAERVLGVRGEFSAGPDSGVWLVSVRLPLADD